MDLVAIVVSNHLHFAIAKAFVEVGFAAVIDKPMVVTSAQAKALGDAARRSGILAAVTYNYAGYPMVRQARHLVRSGRLGDVRRVTLEYEQGWLATPAETAGLKQAQWRTDPARAGLGGAIGAIATHAETLVATVAGLELDAVCANMHAFGARRALDDDANVLIRLNNGPAACSPCRKSPWARTITSRCACTVARARCSGHRNSPTSCGRALSTARSTLSAAAVSGCARTRCAHPSCPAAIRKGLLKPLRTFTSDIADALSHGEAGETDGPFYASVSDGAHGVRFVEAMVSERRKQKITAGRFAYPREIAACTVFPSSDAAAMVTGVNVVIDGVYSIQ